MKLISQKSWWPTNKVSAMGIMAPVAYAFVSSLSAALVGVMPEWVTVDQTALEAALMGLIVSATGWVMPEREQ